MTLVFGQFELPIPHDDSFPSLCCHGSLLPARRSSAKNDGKDSVTSFIKTIAELEHTSSDAMKGASPGGMQAAAIAAVGKAGRVRQEITPKYALPPLANGDGDGASGFAVSAASERVPLSVALLNGSSSDAGGLSPGVGVAREREGERGRGRTFTNWALQVPSKEWLQRRSNCDDGLPMALAASPVVTARGAEKRASHRRELSQEREEKAAFSALQV